MTDEPEVPDSPGSEHCIECGRPWHELAPRPDGRTWVLCETCSRAVQDLIDQIAPDATVEEMYEAMLIERRRQQRQPTGPLFDALTALGDATGANRPGAQARLEAAQAGDDDELLARISDAAADLAAIAMRGRLAPVDAVEIPADGETQPPLRIEPDRGGSKGRAALATAGVRVAHDAPLRIADVVYLDLTADEHHPAERVIAAALLINPHTPLTPGSIALWLRRQADAIDGR